MSGPAQRMIFVLGFLAACVAFWFGWRRGAVHPLSAAAGRKWRVGEGFARPRWRSDPRSGPTAGNWRFPCGSRRRWAAPTDDARGVRGGRSGRPRGTTRFPVSRAARRSPPGEHMWRRLRRLGTAHTRWEALRLAFYLSLTLMVGCSSGTQGTGGTTTTTTTTTTATTTTGLGEEADRVWGELAALWEEAGTYEEGVATSEQLDGARSRVDGLLARLGGLDRVTTDAPGLVALLRIEFLARLEMRPADVLCYEPLPPQTEEAEAYQRLAARVDAVDELASKGYVNSWLRENVLARLRNDLQSIRMGMREGDEWRTEDWRMREVDPGEIERVLERIESVLSRLGGT